MLVVFTNKSGATVDMFEKTAMDLLKMMGRRQSIPSAISKEDLPAALSRLQDELAHLEQLDPSDADDADNEGSDDDKPKAIGLSTRAYPLIELIKQSIKVDSFLMWDYH